MKILDRNQIKEADRYTIQHEPVSSIDLMERSGIKCVDALLSEIHWLHPAHSKPSILLICTAGNNGGDGLVMAYHLHKLGYPVKVVLVEGVTASPENLKNQERVRQEEIPFHSFSPDAEPSLPEADLIIDALFGTGLSRPLEGHFKNWVDHLNRLKKAVISIDVPSGMSIDPEENGDVFKRSMVRADLTLTIQFPKLPFLFPEYYPFTGDWRIIDIGLHPDFISTLQVSHEWVTEDFFTPGMLKRPPFAHKGVFGHSLIIAGSQGKMGAAVLCTCSAVNSGSGLVTAFVPRAGNDILQISVPEAMTLRSEQEEIVSGKIPPLENYDAIGVGPGLGIAPETAAFLKVLIQETKIPLILDADALNILSENKTWLAYLPVNSVLTPHPGEFDRLFGKHETTWQRIQTMREMSRSKGLIILLKGRYTAIALPNGKVYFNSTGNPGMASGGSGDVLTGLITSLYAQTGNMVTSVLFGVFLHGKAGDEAAMGGEPFPTSEIIRSFRPVFSSFCT